MGSMTERSYDSMWGFPMHLQARLLLVFALAIAGCGDIVEFDPTGRPSGGGNPIADSGPADSGLADDVGGGSDADAANDDVAPDLDGAIVDGDVNDSDVQDADVLDGSSERDGHEAGSDGLGSDAVVDAPRDSAPVDGDANGASDGSAADAPDACVVDADLFHPSGFLLFPESSASDDNSYCDDGIDNDCDGLTDCADPDCETFSCGPDCECQSGVPIIRDQCTMFSLDDPNIPLADCNDPDCDGRLCEKFIGGFCRYGLCIILAFTCETRFTPPEELGTCIYADCEGEKCDLNGGTCQQGRCRP